MTDFVTEVRQAEALLKTGALQTAIINSANFSSIATDASGVIQIFNIGAERMLGYAAADVMDKITPADIAFIQKPTTPESLTFKVRQTLTEPAVTQASKTAL